MDIYHLNNDQTVALGANRLFKILYSDLSEGVDDTDETVTLEALAEGDVVKDVRAVLKTDFAGITACNASIGVTSAVTTFSANTSILSGGGIPCAAATVHPYVSPGSVSLLVNFDPAGNGDALDELTAGELWVFATIIKKADLDRLQL